MCIFANLQIFKNQTGNDGTWKKSDSLWFLGPLTSHHPRPKKGKSSLSWNPHVKHKEALGGICVWPPRPYKTGPTPLTRRSKSMAEKMQNHQHKAFTLGWPPSQAVPSMAVGGPANSLGTPAGLISIQRFLAGPPVGAGDKVSTVLLETELVLEAQNSKACSKSRIWAVTLMSYVLCPIWCHQKALF